MNSVNDDGRYRLLFGNNQEASLQRLSLGLDLLVNY